MCVCVFVVIPFILDVRLVDAPAGLVQEEGHTRFILPSVVLAFILISSHPFLSSTVKSNFVYPRFKRSPLVGHDFYFYFFIL